MGDEVLHPDIENDLSALEKELVASHEMCVVRGKRGTPVPVLIPEDCQAAMTYLSRESVRKAAGVGKASDGEGHEFFFANQGKMKCYILYMYIVRSNIFFCL